MGTTSQGSIGPCLSRAKALLCALGGLLLVVATTARPAAALFGTIDVVPAATLLLPYFEVDLADENGATTRFWVRNASPGPTIVHGVVWTDLGVATQTFNILLDGFATFEVDLRSLFVDGSLGVPAFGDDCKDLDETLNSRFSFDLREIHTGGESSFYFEGFCGGAEHRDGIARGFITFDNVSECTDLGPDDDGYFVDDGLGVANNANVLWGEYVLSDPGSGAAQSEPMVHIEARNSFKGGTFYQFIGGLGADNRESLSVRSGVRYFHQLTDVVCWRDVLVQVPFSCDPAGAAPQGIFPASFDVEVQVFDHESNSDLFADSAVPCQLTSGRTTVGSAAFPVSAKTGWLTVDTVPNVGPLLSGFVLEPRRAYLGVIHRIHPNGLTVQSGGVSLDPVQILLPLSHGEQDSGVP